MKVKVDYFPQTYFGGRFPTIVSAKSRAAVPYVITEDGYGTVGAFTAKVDDKGFIKKNPLLLVLHYGI